MQIRAFSDYHVHVREGRQLEEVVQYTTACCGRFMVMPNTHPPIIDAYGMLDYRDQVQRYIQHFSEVLVTIKLLESTDPVTVTECADRGCTAVKIYPVGVTTNSEDGISRGTLESLISSPGTEEGKRFLRNLQAIEDADLVLCIHGELPGEEVLAREIAVLPMVEAILQKFKKLRVVLEHITTKESVEMVCKLDNRHRGRIAATITPHHLMYTLTDLLGDKLNPHLFCKPVLKNKNDQSALVTAAISGRRCFFLGSDSAPWRKGDKECSHGCAGVWNAPTLVPTLFEVFDGKGSLDRLEGFTSASGDLFYGKEPVNRFLTVEKGTWVVPPEIYEMVPFRAGQTMGWRIEGIC
jgi:dihydroorotase